MKRLGVAAMLLAGTMAMAAPPQTVYRCGPDGRVYSQTPCADGKALSTDDPRSPGQQKTAREVAERDAEQAKKLAAERRQREAAAKGQQAAGFKTAPGADAASAPASTRKPKTKPKADSTHADAPMSPPMRVPAQGAAAK